MKHAFSVLLAVTVLVLSLTACGRNNKNDTPPPSDPPTTNQDTVTNDSMPPQNEPSADTNQNDIPMDTESDSLYDPVDPNTDGDAGVSYEQMLRNGRVRDSDGLLRDGENAVRDAGRSIGSAAKDLVRSGKNAVNDMMR